MHLNKVKELALVDHVPKLVKNRSEQLVEVATSDLPDLVAIITTLRKGSEAFLKDRLSVSDDKELHHFYVAFASGAKLAPS